MKKLILDLGFLIQFACDDFKRKYAGSLLGVAWAFLQPLTTILVYWFVFQMGFKSQPVENVPFIFWLITGLVPWFFFSEAVTGGTASLVEYSYLVKKVLFNIDILPLVKIISAFVVQLFLIMFTFILMFVFRLRPDISCLQLIYYSIYMVLLASAISFLTSAIYVFFKDLLQLISIILQLVFWMTPMVWDINIMPISVQNLLKLNPLYYVVLGYRNAFIYKKPLFSLGVMDIYYWIVVLVLLFCGIKLFKKVKPHFADVL